MPHLVDLGDIHPQFAGAPRRLNRERLNAYGITGGFVYLPEWLRPPIWRTGDLTLIPGEERDGTVSFPRPDLIYLTPIQGRRGELAGQFNQDSSGRYLRLATGAPQSQSMTFLSRVRANDNFTGASVGLGLFDSNGGNRNIYWWRNGGQFDFRIANTNYTQAGTWTLGEWYDIDIISSSTACILQVDGSTLINGSAAASEAVQDSVQIGPTASTGGFDIEYAIWSQYVLSDGQRNSLRNDPWQLFDPEPIHIYWASAVSAATDLSSNGTATAIGAGAALLSSAISAGGASTAVGVGAAILSSDLNANGSATGILTAVAIGVSAGDLTADGSATATSVGAALLSSDLSAAGASTAIAAAAADIVTVLSTDLSAAGEATGTLEGSEVAVGVESGAASSEGTATATAASASIASAAASAAGAATATAEGASTAEGAFSSAGAATAIAVGSDTDAVVTPTRYDGWLPREVIRLQRKRREEEALIALVMAMDEDMRRAA